MSSCTSASRPPMIPAIACGRRFGVAHEQILGGERALDPVERGHPLAVVREPHHESPARQPVQVERVQRLAPLEQHVVGDVDDVRDRPHAGERRGGGRATPATPPSSPRCAATVKRGQRSGASIAHA